MRFRTLFLRDSVNKIMMKGTEKGTVIVVGGGISGLATAFWLHQRGVSVQLLERASRAGGLINSERKHGFLLEDAATCIFNFLPEVDLFCRNLGLSDQQVFRQKEARRRYLLKNSRMIQAPMNAMGFVTTPSSALRQSFGSFWSLWFQKGRKRGIKRLLRSLSRVGLDTKCLNKPLSPISQGLWPEMLNRPVEASSRKSSRSFRSLQPSSALQR